MSDVTSVMRLEDSLLLDDIFDNLRQGGLNEFYPTQAGYKFEDGTTIGKCMRALWFEKLGITGEKLSLRTRHIFEFGNLLEAYVIENHKRLGIYWKEQVPFTWIIRDIILRGRFDEIVVLDGKPVGVEIKSGSGYNFLRQHIAGYKRGPQKKSQPHLINQMQPAPKPEHLLQAAIYLLFTNTQLVPYTGGLTIDEWRLEYRATDTKLGAEYRITLEENSGLHKVKVHRIYVSSNAEFESDEPLIDYSQIELKEHIEEIVLKDIYVEKILERFLNVYDYIKKGIVPPADYDYTVENGKTRDWQCEYCPFSYLCKSMSRGEVDGNYLTIASDSLKHYTIATGR